MRTFAAAARAEAAAILRDPAARLVLVAAAAVYGLLYPIPYSRQLARDLPVAVVDADRSAFSRRLTRMLDATEQIDVRYVVASLAEAERLVGSGRARGVITVGEGFERAVQRGERFAIGVHADASSFMIYTQVATGAAQAIGTLSAGIEVRRLQAGGVHGGHALERREPLRLRAHGVFNPVHAYGSAIVPAVFILLLQQTLLVGIGALAGGRRESGMADAPLSRETCMADGPRRGHGASAAALARNASLLLGRGSAYVLLYGAHALGFYFILYRIHGVPLRGAPSTALLFLLPFLLATTFLGMTISTAFRERETALPVLATTSLPVVFVSGFPWPAEALPGWLRAASQLLPSTAGIDGAVRISQLGATLAEVQGRWLQLWLLAALYFAAALLTDRLQPHRP